MHYFHRVLDSPNTPKGLKTEIEKALVTSERAVMSEVETSTLRVPVGEGLLHAIVTGNGLLYMPDTGGCKSYPLDSYVVKRDPMGNILEIIIKESVHPVALPEDVQDAVANAEKNADDTVDVYTYVKRLKNKWSVFQEVGDQEIPGTNGTYALDNCPWLSIPWKLIRGEDYGRGLVEEYYGDLMSLEELTKAIVLYSVAAAKILVMVNPNGAVSEEDIANSKSGDVITGSKDEVTILQLDKYYDLRVAQETIADIKMRLEQAFLLTSSIQRDAERVTAEEIREMAKDLENGLGGVYASLSQTLQLPLVQRLMKIMTKQKKLPNLPNLPKGTIKPMIITGLEALGRGNDLTKLSLFMGQVQALGPEAQMYINTDVLLTKLVNSLGIDAKDLLKSREEVAQAQQIAQQQAMIANAVPDIVKGAMSNAQGQEATAGATTS
jgi:hypothetical protein